MRCEFCQGAGHVGYERDWLWTREGNGTEGQER
jgi:hypothetical protein